ncbi:hypothetical protein LTR37_020390 [Vermiconidia calcicola]|uniref:Uncharacterized protein n=1 Tax=Vermiconidia calcicola TaxID=1690605 RepID=A0ACC3MBG4_9PEZI|nr:hypothetical protein LTR37_020390 [Vermiconidia calcicola]
MGEQSKNADSLNNSFSAHGSSSWTDVLPKTGHADFFRRTDFGPTLGEVSRWGPALRFYTTMLFADSRATCIYWGPERVAIYNEPCIEVMGGPDANRFGKSCKEAFPEIWDAMQPIFDTAAATEHTVDVADILLFPLRSGRAEESYFIGQFIPLRGDSGEIEGFYNPVVETTIQVLHERRRKVLEAVASIPPSPVGDTLDRVMEILQSNPHDIPMAMLYSLDEGATVRSGQVQLRGSIGIPAGGLRCAPSTAELGADDAGLLPYLRQAMNTGSPVVLTQSDSSLEATGHLFERVAWVGYGEPSRDIVVVPLSSGGRMLGFYVQGTNPRRAYDQAAQRSIVDLVRQIEVKWASSISTEEAKMREEMLERSLTDRERRLRHMAQSAPIGFVQIAQEHGAHIEWANKQFYDITGHTDTRPAISDFLECVAPEDRERAFSDLGTLFEDETRVVSELRLTRRWSPPVDEDDDAGCNTAWILAIAISVFEDGKYSVMGYVYDISHQKWAESVQSRNAEAATIAKRRQEEFIDVTSHEMRNPLTAIVQLADGISKSLSATEDTVTTTRDVYRAVANNSVESANTILACANHLQRVIDDVLMLSRLESQMLSITPVVAQPTDVVTNTVKMFDGEVVLHGTKIEVVRDESYQSMQILINLISNAIKFTASRAERKISIVYGAQAKRPPAIETLFGELKWMESSEGQQVSPALRQHDEAPLYLYFCVQDTGPGVMPHELDQLFKRFSQANSRTHISYGGSGLGLYICRQLAEKQGGGVGVASRPDEGSVFGFYMETRRADGVEHTSDISSHAPQVPVTLSTKRPDLPQRMASKEGTPTVNGQPEDLSPTPQLNGARHRAHVGGYNVLLVEDNLVNQKILAKQLRTAKCTVAVANHGEEALEVLKSTTSWRHQEYEADSNRIPLEVILMDWEMPVMNGLACAERIRELEREGRLTRSIPIIAITANVREEQMVKALAAGMDNVMPKPFTVSELLARIGDTIKQRSKENKPP